MPEVQVPLSHRPLNADGVFSSADDRRAHLERRLEFICTASRTLEGDEVTREEVIKWMAGEPDPQRALDALVRECREALGLEVA